MGNPGAQHLGSGRRGGGGWRIGLRTGVLVGACLLALTMVLSGVPAFFIHDG